MNSYPLISWLSAHMPSVKSHLTHDYFVCVQIYIQGVPGILKRLFQDFFHRYWELGGGGGVSQKLTQNDQG